MIKSAAESENYARRVNDTLGVYVVPAFTGLGAPYWDDDCRGAIFGLTRGTKKEHFIRATLNSIALQTKDVIDEMSKVTKKKIEILKVDGGASENSYLMQFQSDILNSEVNLPKNLETTSLGAAYLAGLESGYWKDIDEISKVHKINKKYFPSLDEKDILEITNKWKKAVEATRVFR